MKTTLLLAGLAFAVTTSAWAQSKHDHAKDHRPVHGGAMVVVGHMDYELVVKPTAVQLYLREEGKPIDLSKASARLTLLTGSQKQELALVPAGDKLEATGSFEHAAGSKAVAVVKLAGKPASSVRFAVK